MIGDMCNEINFDIHFCRDEETHFACELATMQDFESVHPDSSVTCHQDLKSWDTFYHVASRLIGECTTIVAVEDGKVIGVANYICSSAYGTINYLYVLPKCRHQGIGNALLKRAEEHMLKCAENAYNLQSGKAPHCGALWATRGENASGSLSCTFIEQAGSQRISP